MDDKERVDLEESLKESARRIKESEERLEHLKRRSEQHKQNMVIDGIIENASIIIAVIMVGLIALGVIFFPEFM